MSEEVPSVEPEQPPEGAEKKPKKKAEPEDLGPPKYKYRYTVGLAKKEEPNCYVDFHETNSLAEAKDKCVDRACDEGRECIVYDREGWGDPFVFRHKPVTEVKDDTPTTATPKPAPRPKKRR